MTDINSKECYIDIENSGGHFNSFGNYKSCLENKNTNFFILENGFVKEGANYYGMTLSICASILCQKEDIIKQISPKFGILDSKETPMIPENTVIYDIRELESKYGSLDVFSCLFILISVLLLTYSIYASCRFENNKENIFYKQFSLRINFKRILYPSIKSPSAQAFDIIRALCMFLVIFGHIVMISHVVDAYSRDADKSYDEWARNDWIAGIPQNGIYAVTAFFFMGGYVSILSGNKVVKRCEELGKGRVYIIIFMIVRRIFRVLPMMFYFVFFYFKITPLMIKGPGLVEFSKKYLCDFRQFLNIMSLPIFTVSSGYKICGEHLWYIQSDMRFFILTVFLNNFVKRKRLAIIICVLIIIGSSLASCYYLICNEVYYSSDAYFYLYFKEYYRARIYFLGCLVAYLTQKDKPRTQKHIVNGQRDNELSVLSSKSKRSDKGDSIVLKDIEQIGERPRVALLKVRV